MSLAFFLNRSPVTKTVRILSSAFYERKKNIMCFRFLVTNQVLDRFYKDQNNKSVHADQKHG
jgi:hypothetical protein